jgi:hypothetical protein
MALAFFSQDERIEDRWLRELLMRKICRSAILLAVTAMLSTHEIILPALAQEMPCRELLLQCGDGPALVRNTTNSTNSMNSISSVGGGSISTQCTGIISGVLASYKNCHGALTWAGAAAVLIHFVHEKPELLKMTGWECARAAYKNAFACQKN